MNWWLKARLYIIHAENKSLGDTSFHEKSDPFRLLIQLNAASTSPQRKFALRDIEGMCLSIAIYKGLQESRTFPGYY